MKNQPLHRHPFHPTIVYGLVGAVAFFQCLFLGRSYFDDDLLGYDGVFRQFLKDALGSGHIPLWNPYLFGGQPFWADPGVMAAYPLVYPCLLFPTGYGMGLFLFAHFLIAATGMHRWLNNLGFSTNAAFVGALTFSLSGFFWGEVIHPQCLASFAWAAWFMSCLEGILSCPNRSAALGAGLSLALLFLSGYPQIFLGTAIFGCLYFFFRLHQRKKGISQSVPLFLWGLFPMLCLAIPFWEFSGFSDRLALNLDYQTFSANLSLAPSDLYQFLFPVHPIPGSSSYEDHIANAGYIGVWGPFLCLLAFKNKKRPLSWLLAFIGLFFFLVSLGKFFPLHQWLCGWVPGLRMLRGPFRFIFIPVMCLSVLAATGWETLETHPPKWRRPLIFLVLYATGTFLWAWYLRSLDWTLACVLASGVGSLFLWAKNKRSTAFGSLLFLLTLLLSLLWSGWKSCPSRLGPESNFNFQKETGLISKLKAQVGDTRVFMGDNIPYDLESQGRRFQEEFPTNAACLFGLRNVGANNPLSLLKRGQLHNLPFATFTRLMAIGGFVTGNDHGPVPGFVKLEEGPVMIYKAQVTPPMVYSPARTQVFRDEPSQLTSMGAPDFNPYQLSVLSWKPLLPFSSPTPKMGKDLQNERVLDELDRQVYRIRMDRNGWVIFSEVNYPGWKVWIDGNPGSISNLNYLFRGIFINAGDHMVEFRFEPTWFRLLLFGLLLWIPWTLWMVLRSNRSS